MAAKITFVILAIMAVCCLASPLPEPGYGGYGGAIGHQNFNLGVGYGGYGGGFGGGFGHGGFGHGGFGGGFGHGGGYGGGFGGFHG